MALKGALRSYAAARELITPELEPLVLSHLKNIRGSIAEAFGVPTEVHIRSSSSRRIRWGAREIGEWVAGLTELVTRFEERVEILLQACGKVEMLLVSLAKVDYDRCQMKRIVESIQKIIDELSLAGYTELHSWVSIVNQRMSAVLRERLEKAIEEWVVAFTTDRICKIEEMKDEGNDNLPLLKIPPINIEIYLRNQEISVSPSLPAVRSIFVQELHKYMGIVCSLESPESGRFEVFNSAKPSKDHVTVPTFGHLAQEIDPLLLSSAYGSIESHMETVSGFVCEWLAYQTLWDIRVFDVASAIGDNMDLWRSVLDEASVARKALDTSQTFSKFGAIVCKFDKVQSQINLKYDSWQKELQTSYANVLGQKVVDLHQVLERSKSRLEDICLDGGASTEDIVAGVTLIQEVNGKIEPFGETVENLLHAERSLRRERHSFHPRWLEGSRLRGQYNHLQQILQKRNRGMEEQLPLLQTRVMSEDKIADQRMVEILTSWDEEKPLRGNIAPPEAIELLSKYEFTIKKAKVDDDNLIKAKDALGLAISTSNSAISSCYEELIDLKEVWTALSDPHKTLDKIKEISWAAVSTRKIRKSLDDALAGE